MPLFPYKLLIDMIISTYKYGVLDLQKQSDISKFKETIPNF